MPDDLLEEVEAEARRRDVSRNAVILELLREALALAKRPRGKI